MKTYIFLILSLFFTVSITAQNVARKFIDAENIHDGTQVSIKVSDGYYLIRPFSSHIVETTFVPNGEVLKPESHTVILKPNASKFKISEIGQDIILTTNDELSVTITKTPFQISYYYKGKLITSEKAGYVKNDSLETIEFNLTKDEVLYGGGARALGMNRRGHRLQLYNRAHYGYETHSELMNFTLPIVLSSNKYMIHFDNAPIGFLDLDSKGDNTLKYETISGRKTYQVIVGDSWYDITNNYTDLTGKQPMLPRWALGNFSSRFGYHSQEEVEMTIAKFKEEEIPVDAIILDLYWFGKDLKGTMGNLEVFRDSFPDFEGMVKRLNNKGVKTITITEPFVLTTSKKWDEAVEKDVLAKDSIGNPAKYDFYFGNTGLIDIYKPEGEKWFWNIYKELVKMGVAGIWGDLGEPEVHPSWVQHHTGSADEVHNIYGHDWARLIHEGYQRDFPNTRPFILMRAGYSGSQRYGMIPWSGDVNRTWGGLQSQPEIALQMSMQGLAYMHSDLGGFAGANLDDELYVRWLQYGVFNPIFRPHAQEDVPSEPIFRSEKAKSLAKEAIELRYRLLPYNYNLVYENNQFGKPLMRPLFFEESDNPELFNYSKTYLWGNDILVSPVLEAGKKEQEVYFPKNNVWFDFYTHEKIEGGQTKTVQLKDNSIPTYVRAGAFIPMAKLMQTTIDYKDTYYQVHYYYDESVTASSAQIYTDNGMSSGPIQNENYELLSFNMSRKGHRLQFEINDVIGDNLETEGRVFYLLIHGLDKKPKSVIVGPSRRFEWDENSKVLKIPVERNPREHSLIKIKLKK
ncbi:glycoside hydrolase family 31 protein [Winogradskyella sediminis]|uniref:Oligosaccharide 4-alpha-D-glucosyltransferase n=1 Tax=Winogradskyella sediminis TaxID=1382466 RepID=A0A1H1QHS0_9FLAO|nr:TIM-barrel domain-containing protein [Winogradskyella sediminis]SDS22853.1 oligosaccharide 4-alpha-D-glucosyltransferase [Winogradskyella sediminis]